MSAAGKAAAAAASVVVKQEPEGQVREESSDDEAYMDTNPAGSDENEASADDRGRSRKRKNGRGDNGATSSTAAASRGGDAISERPSKRARTQATEPPPAAAAAAASSAVSGSTAMEEDDDDDDDNSNDNDNDSTIKKKVKKENGTGGGAAGGKKPPPAIGVKKDDNDGGDERKRTSQSKLESSAQAASAAAAVAAVAKGKSLTSNEAVALEAMTMAPPRPIAPVGSKRSNKLLLFNSDYCPFGQRAWLTLLEKGVNFELREVNLFNKPPEFVKLFPTGTVPAALHRGKKLWESLTFARYVDEAFHGPPLMPKHPYKRYVANMLISQFDQNLFKPFYLALSTQRKEQQARLVEQIHHIMGVMNKALVANSDGGPYFLGAQFSLVDICILPFVERIITVLGHYRQFAIPRTPEFVPLHKWLRACFSRRSWHLTTAPRSQQSLIAHPFPQRTRKEYLIAVYRMYAENRIKEVTQHLRSAEPPKLV